MWFTGSYVMKIKNKKKLISISKERMGNYRI